MSFRRWVFGVSLVAGMTGCCGDDEAWLRVHVVDGETGVLVYQPTVLADDVQLRCDDDRAYLSPDLGDVPDGGELDDGGAVPPPVNRDMTVGPPPDRRWCETHSAMLGAGFHTLRVTASGYFATSVQVDMGDGGDSFSCPDTHDVETTVALYKRP